jgi:two-component system cell cycle sensor histidine kinase/response regulator CckA
MDYHSGKPTVLVVEDDANLRRLVVHMLTNGGFETLDASTAADGLSTVRKRQGGFDLAILDIVMPGTSGLDLASDLDREYPGLQILYISGYIGSPAADVLSRRTPDHVLLKPFTEEALLERVRLLLEIAPRRAAGTAAPPLGSVMRNGTAG